MSGQYRPNVWLQELFENRIFGAEEAIAISLSSGHAGVTIFCPKPRPKTSFLKRRGPQASVFGRSVIEAHPGLRWAPGSRTLGNSKRYVGQSSFRNDPRKFRAQCVRAPAGRKAYRHRSLRPGGNVATTSPAPAPGDQVTPRREGAASGAKGALSKQMARRCQRCPSWRWIAGSGTSQRWVLWRTWWLSEAGEFSTYRCEADAVDGPGSEAQSTDPGQVGDGRGAALQELEPVW